MNITKEQLKRIIKEEIENLQENPYAEDDAFGEEDENPLVRAANDALFELINAIDDGNTSGMYSGRVTISDVLSKVDQLKRVLG